MRRLRLATIVVVTDSTPTIHQHGNRSVELLIIGAGPAGATAAILAGLQYYDWWAAYTGIVSYVLMGLLFAGEWVYRKTVLKV